MKRRCRGQRKFLIQPRMKGGSGPLFQKATKSVCIHSQGQRLGAGAPIPPPLDNIYIDDAAKDIIVLVASGPVTATTPACGWTYSVNGGVDTAPASASTNLNVLELTMVTPATCGDVVTVSYDATGCDLAVGGVPVDSEADRAVTNNVVSPNPAITVQPTAQTVTDGQTATFSLTATDATSYQWYRDSILISGATSNSYTTPATALPESGDVFQCDVINACGSVLSDAVQLTVEAKLPFITTWRTTGVDETITLPFITIAPDINVDWGDGSEIEHVTAATPTHQYAVADDYDVSVSIVTSFGNWDQNNAGDYIKIIELKQWGSFDASAINAFTDAFEGCLNMVITATDVPEGIDGNWVRSFVLCSSITDIPNLDQWPVDHVDKANGLCPAGSILTTTYDQTLIAWGPQAVITGVTWNFGTSKYTDGGAAKAGRDQLIAAGGTVTDGGPVV